MQKKLSIIIIAVALVIAGVVVYVVKKSGEKNNTTTETPNQPNKDSAATAANTPAAQPAIADMKYGLDMSKYETETHEIKKGESFTKILKHKVSAATINALDKQVKDVFDVTKMRAGKTLLLLHDKGAPETKVSKVVYLEDPANYVVFSVGDSLYAYRGKM